MINTFTCRSEIVKLWYDIETHISSTEIDSCGWALYFNPKRNNHGKRYKYNRFFIYGQTQKGMA